MEFLYFTMKSATIGIHKTEKSRSIALALQFPQDLEARVEVCILAEKWYVEM